MSEYAMHVHHAALRGEHLSRSIWASTDWSANGTTTLNLSVHVGYCATLMVSHIMKYVDGGGGEKQPEKLVFIPEKFTMVAEPNRRRIARCSHLTSFCNTHFGNFSRAFVSFVVNSPKQKASPRSKTSCRTDSASSSSSSSSPPIPKAAVRQKSALPPRYLMVTKDSSSSFPSSFLPPASFEFSMHCEKRKTSEQAKGREGEEARVSRLSWGQVEKAPSEHFSPGRYGESADSRPAFKLLTCGEAGRSSKGRFIFLIFFSITNEQMPKLA